MYVSKRPFEDRQSTWLCRMIKGNLDSELDPGIEIYAPINVKPQGGGGGGGRAWGGILTFSFKRIKIPHPWDKRIGQNVHPAASEGGKMSFVRSTKLLALGHHI